MHLGRWADLQAQRGIEAGEAQDAGVVPCLLGRVQAVQDLIPQPPLCLLQHLQERKMTLRYEPSADLMQLRSHTLAGYRAATAAKQLVQVRWSACLGADSAEELSKVSCPRITWKTRDIVRHMQGAHGVAEEAYSSLLLQLVAVQLVSDIAELLIQLQILADMLCGRLKVPCRQGSPAPRAF